MLDMQKVPIFSQANTMKNMNSFGNSFISKGTGIANVQFIGISKFAKKGPRLCIPWIRHLCHLGHFEFHRPYVSKKC